MSIARQEQPKAIIVDLDVPGIDVEAVCNELRATPRGEVHYLGMRKVFDFTRETAEALCAWSRAISVFFC